MLSEKEALEALNVTVGLGQDTYYY